MLDVSGRKCFVYTKHYRKYGNFIRHRKIFRFCVGDEKHWPSTPISLRSAELNGTNSTISTPSTISPAPEQSLEEDLTNKVSYEFDKTDNLRANYKDR